MPYNNNVEFRPTKLVGLALQVEAYSLHLLRWNALVERPKIELIDHPSAYVNSYD